MQGCEGKRRSRKAAGFSAQAAESTTAPLPGLVTAKEQIWSAGMETLWDKGKHLYPLWHLSLCGVLPPLSASRPKRRVCV